MATIHRLEWKEVQAISRYRDIIEQELAQDIIDYGSEPGLRALHVVSRAGEVELARELIRKHANVDFFTTKGLSPLHYAVLSGKSNMIRLLLLYGARINIRSPRDGKTPLFVAAEKGGLDLVQFLLENGANPRIADHNETLPAEAAASHGHMDVKHALEAHCRSLPTDDIAPHPVFALMNHRQRRPQRPPSPPSPLSSMTLSPSQFLPPPSSNFPPPTTTAPPPPPQLEPDPPTSEPTPPPPAYSDPPPTYEEVMSSDSLFGCTAYSQSPDDSDTTALLGED